MIVSAVGIQRRKLFLWAKTIRLLFMRIIMNENRNRIDVNGGWIAHMDSTKAHTT